jgi:ubiquinone/menaquinone biosynthesis C-methylase UbiE
MGVNQFGVEAQSYTQRLAPKEDEMKKVENENSTPGTTGLVLHRAARFYDFMVWVAMPGRERFFREKVIDLARVKPGESILDVGCGTGTLAIAAKRRVGPTGEVYGIDASPEMVARASRKAEKAMVEVVFKSGVVEALPFPDAHFDVVLSTLMLHHLPRKAREQCALEIRRVLKPSGRVLAVDFGGSERKKRGVLANFHHRHGHVKLSDMIAVLSGAGLNSVESGAVGIKDLNFVLATADAAPNHERRDERTETTSGHTRSSVRLLMALLGVVALIAGHGIILYYVSSHTALSVAIVLAVIVLVVVKHLGLLSILHALFQRWSRH